MVKFGLGLGWLWCENGLHAEMSWHPLNYAVW